MSVEKFVEHSLNEIIPRQMKEKQQELDGIIRLPQRRKWSQE